MMQADKLKTSRLIIHLAQTVSADAILNYYIANKNHFALTEALRPPSFYTLDYWNEQILTQKKEFESDQSIRFVLSLSESPSQVMGTINFTQICRGPFQACYLGYAISHEQQGKGLMTEALNETIRYIFNEKNLHRIMANYLPTNTPSEKVLKKLGFVIEGRADRYLFINGEWREHILTSLTNDQWKS